MNRSRFYLYPLSLLVIFPIITSCSGGNGGGGGGAAVQALLQLLAGGGGPGFADGTGMAARFNNPLGAAVGAQGNIFVADNANHAVRRVTPAGVTTTLAARMLPNRALNQGVLHNFDFPSDIAVSPDGMLIFVGNLENDTISISQNGGATWNAVGGPGTSPGQFNDPVQLAFNPQTGRLFVADAGNDRIQFTDNFGQTWQAQPFPSGINNPLGFDVGPGNDLIVLNGGGGSDLFHIDGATNAMTGIDIPNFQFTAGPNIAGGIRVAAGDVNADGEIDIVGVPGAGQQVLSGGGGGSSIFLFDITDPQSPFTIHQTDLASHGFTGAAPTGVAFDPQVIWDPTTNRFYYTVSDPGTDGIFAANNVPLTGLGGQVQQGVNTLPNGTVGQAYKQNLDAPQGTFAGRHRGGTLPPGTSITNDGMGNFFLEGTPTTPGTYTFTVRFTTPTSRVDKMYTVTIAAGGGGGTNLLRLSSNSVSDTHIPGSTGCPDTVGSVSVFNETSNVVNFSITSNNPFLQPSPASGSISGGGSTGLSAIFNCGDLPPQNGIFTINASSGGQSEIETLNVTVNSGSIGRSRTLKR